MGLYNTFAVEHFKSSEAVHENSSIEYELSYILNILTQTLNFVDHLVLLYGICKFYCHEHKKRNLETVRDIIRHSLSCSKLSDDFWSIYWVLFVLSMILVQFVASFHPLVLLIYFTVHSNDIAPYNEKYNLGSWAGRLSHASITIEGLSHFYNFVARTAMIVATLLVRAKWNKEKEAATLLVRAAWNKEKEAATLPVRAEPNEETEELNKDLTNTGHDSVKPIFEELIKKYKTAGELAASIQWIFQSWFVVKWIIYFTDISVHGTVAIKQLSSGTKATENDQLWFVFSHLIYDLTAFITIYTCGTLMNDYHAKFRTELENKQEELLSTCKSESESLWINQYGNLIRSNPDYQFIPSFCGIDVPLDNPGYTLTVLVALFSFIANFISNVA